MFLSDSPASQIVANMLSNVVVAYIFNKKIIVTTYLC